MTYRLAARPRVREPIDEHEVDRLGRIEAMREARMVALWQRHHKLPGLLDGATHRHACIEELPGRHHRRLLDEELRVDIDFARKRAGEGALEALSVARAHTVPRLGRSFM